MTTPPAASDVTLGRPTEELNRFLEQCRPVIRGLCSRAGVPLQDADDLTQDVGIVMCRHWERIRDPKHFLRVAVRRRIALFFRRRARRKLVALAAAQLDRRGGGDSPQRAVDARHDARKLLAQLPPRDRRIAALRYGERVASREVAAELHCSNELVRQVAGRSLRRMRRHAEELAFNPSPAGP
ncbi:MAG TPA: sigma-70 family RNA polymerase sigma factor [Thermoanaerobaculia bacterium]|nr:sigma-70 family RNA polymerase sigma factor [Thermoanaerobaculia bacterium]